MCDHKRKRVDTFPENGTYKQVCLNCGDVSYVPYFEENKKNSVKKYFPKVVRL